MPKINSKANFERKQGVRRRGSVEYVPYTRDRDAMGQIINPQMEELSQHVSLHRDIQNFALKKGNDPKRLTTHQALMKIKENTKHKISMSY